MGSEREKERGTFALLLLPFLSEAVRNARHSHDERVRISIIRRDSGSVPNPTNLDATRYAKQRVIEISDNTSDPA
ncbi:unnamed protein product [Sphenostylis stenocarpa]|uniref:Uncharacterized protein n=1 Tax=Sphenostylis stenocarpa TaxID=92480 RepID=A0AA86RNV9_9FABA|nr:unnamed protein product [Sphenostylis stenocarpa]